MQAKFKILCIILKWLFMLLDLSPHSLDFTVMVSVFAPSWRPHVEYAVLKKKEKKKKHHSKVYFKSISKGTFHPDNLHRTHWSKEACNAFQLNANKGIEEKKSYFKYMLHNTSCLPLKQAEDSSIAYIAEI